METRLDNVVYRLGFASTRPFARQVVSHGHVKVNGRKVSTPSYQVKVGDVIEVRNSPVSQQLVTKSLESAQVRPVPEWITFQRDAMRAQVARMPTRDDIQPIVEPQLIVEFYSR